MKQFNSKEIHKKQKKEARKALTKKFKEKGAHSTQAKKIAKKYTDEWGADTPELKNLSKSKGKLKIGMS